MPTQALGIGSAFANLGKQMFQGQAMYDKGLNEASKSRLEQEMLGARARDFDAQAGLNTTKAEQLKQRMQYQTPAEIRRRWGWHPLVDELVTGSGVTGDAACKAWKAQHRDIRVSYDDALRVFTTYTWPSYLRMAERAYRNGWKSLSLRHQGGLGSNGYNRGFSMVGSRNTEKRHTRDVCVPANDADCTAADLIASCRIWDNQPAIRNGLCARRHDEARFVRS